MMPGLESLEQPDRRGRQTFVASGLEAVPEGVSAYEEVLADTLRTRSRSCRSADRGV